MKSASPSGARKFERLLGTYTQGAAGPMVIILGGIHGNEPAGVHAASRVLARLQNDQVPIAGKVVAFAGNLAALELGERFLSRDLNRKWRASHPAGLGLESQNGDAEELQQRELIGLFEQCIADARGPVLFLDLHTSSADGPPFCCMGDTLPNRHIAFALQMPVILGLEEAVDGAVLEYFNDRGLAGVAIEGGQHQRRNTVDRLEAAVWLGLIAAGAVTEADVPRVESFRALLREASGDAPAVVEVREHHKITPADEFVMAPGFESFHRVKAGDLLARDRNGEVRAGEAGRVVLPLYQGLGEDGFFLCRDVQPFWLKVAAWMRMLRLDFAVRWLPGVRRHPQRHNALLVDPRVARWFVREVFHLLGYRRCREEGDRLVFSRRTVAPVTRLLPWRG